MGYGPAGIESPPRRREKVAYTLADMSIEEIEQIANNRMDDEYAHLDALMDE